MKNTIQKAVCAALLLLPMTAFGAEAAAGAVKKSFIDVLADGGWCMYPIGAFSIATVWLIIDIWMRTNNKKMVPEEDVSVAQQAFLGGDYIGAYQAMKEADSPFANVVRAALSSIGYGKDATEEALIAEVDKVNSKLQTRINYLSVIGGLHADGRAARYGFRDARGLRQSRFGRYRRSCGAIGSYW